MTLQKRQSRRTTHLLAAMGLATAVGGCKACDFVPTPPPHASIKGKVNGLPPALQTRLEGVSLEVRALAVDGRLLASTNTKVGQEFTLELEPNIGDQYAVRVLVGAGSVQLRTLAPEVLDIRDKDVEPKELGEVGLASTAAALLVEAYAASSRSGLAGMPPKVTEKVLANGTDTAKPPVAAFHEALSNILSNLDPARGEAAFADVGGAPSEPALDGASLTKAQYDAWLAAAVEAVGVPVVCDQGRLRVMWTVDVSGQALDGNAKKQFMRQAPKEGRVFLGITLDPSSPVADSAGTLKTRLTPNDPDTEMFDDGTHGDEVASDQIFTLTMELPTGMRVIYKYTDGSPREGYTGTEEWPGNARILEVRDVITGNPNGTPDCLVIRRDSFGDESTNKNYVNLHTTLGGGALGYNEDLGGATVTIPTDPKLLPVGGIPTDGLKSLAPLTPAGIPEARENGQCTVCPPPVTVPVDDTTPPYVISARFSATDEVVMLFSEDLDLQSASDRNNYLLVDDSNTVIPIRKVGVAGAQVKLGVDSVDPRKQHTLVLKKIADASLDRNVIAENTRVTVGTDTTPPTVTHARGTAITEVNPAARPNPPDAGEVVVVTFSEVLDRISAENVVNYRINGAGKNLPVHAAFQRGKDVLLVTDSMTGGAEYTVTVKQVFDVAGNLLKGEASVTFKGLKLYKVQLNAVPGHAFLNADGSQRGLPAGEGLYVTGTIQTEARGADGADIRVSGRTDVTGRDGYRMEPVEAELVSGKPVHRLELLLPPGTYAYKLAHGKPSDVAAPPITLEAVTKNLATTADATGVAVNPITLMGADGLSYAGATLSITGEDAPGPTVLFKRENPDIMVQVVDRDVIAPTHIIGAWRDVPFGQGQDYDDGLREMPMNTSGEVDQTGPVVIAAEARDSESVLVSFDEAISGQPADLTVAITDDANVPLSALVACAGLPRPNQAVLKTAPMALNKGYTVMVSRSADLGGHVTTDARTVGYASPASFLPFTPCVDTDPPRVVSVTATSPTSVVVTFHEKVAGTASEATRYRIEKRAGGPGPLVKSARLIRGGKAVTLATEPQEQGAAYTLVLSGIADLATPPNVIESERKEFDGYFDNTPPTLLWAKPVTPNRVVLKFSEDVDATTASVAGNYSLTGGLSIERAESSHGPEVRNSSYNPASPLKGDLVVLYTSTMTAATAYTVTVTGVLDVAGNPSSSTSDFMGIASAPVVSLELNYLTSATATVMGTAPSRGLSPAELTSQREGVFVLGTALTEDGAGPITSHPITAALTGFPAEGEPLSGVEPQLRDDGQEGDVAAKDNIHTVVIANVPLGSVISYKAFASFKPGVNPVADTPPGPSVFSDGQEYPGHDNSAWVLADENGDGRVVLHNLYGDELTYKRKTGFRPFVWVTDEHVREE